MHCKIANKKFLVNEKVHYFLYVISILPPPPKKKIVVYRVEGSYIESNLKTDQPLNVIQVTN